MPTFETVADLATKTGDLLGTSDWLTITQDQIDMFAGATGDDQWIHVDPDRAAAGPFGTTIAHGLMTLALVPGLAREMFEVKNVDMGLNYGLNKVRYPAPVPTGSRVRAHVTLVGVEEVGPAAAQVAISVEIEIEGNAKPAVVAEFLIRFVS